METRRTSYGLLATRIRRREEAPGNLVEMVVDLEALGISRVWLPHLLGLDPLPMFAAAAGRTTSIRFGTAVAPTWSRHPIALMQEAFAVQVICRGRLILGVGVSDVATIRDSLGIAWHDPVGHLREYLTVCSQARTGTVDFDGRYFQVHTTLADTPEARLPVVASGLNPGTIEAAAELADGLVTWLAPPSYLSAVVRPRISACQDESDFKLISCVPVAVTDNVKAAEAAAEDLFRPYWGYTGYASMLRTAGITRAADFAVVGKEGTVAAALEQYVGVGVDEVVAAPFPVSDDPEVIERTVRFVAELSGR